MCLPSFLFIYLFYFFTVCCLFR